MQDKRKISSQLTFVKRVIGTCIREDRALNGTVVYSASYVANAVLMIGCEMNAYEFIVE